jgi:hypothetical protein
MKRPLRNVVDAADRFLQSRPLATLACLTGLCVAAEFFLLREVGTVLDAIHHATASPGVASPPDDVADRSDWDRAGPAISSRGVEAGMPPPGRVGDRPQPDETGDQGYADSTQAPLIDSRLSVAR